MMNNVHVVGTGLISAIGHSVAESFHSLQNEISGVGSLTLFKSVHQNLPVAEVKLSNGALAEKLSLPKTLSRTALLGVHAGREAIVNSGINHFRKWKSGLISATTVGGMDKTENFYEHFMSKPSSGRLRDVVQHPCSYSTEIMADDFGVNGFVSTINTACSSSINSIILGSRLIREGMLDVVIVGGTDALTKFTLNGFNSLMILDSQPCRPFDASRNGLNLGEGAGFLVMVSEKVLKDENLKSICHIAGHGNATDAYHQTASSPEGRGSFSAMDAALKLSGLSTEDIDYINLHGTGTQNNDLSEGTAIKRLFAEKLPRMSSTKGFTGHTLGASGGIEAVFSCLSISEQCIFSNPRFETAMPELNIEPQRKFEEKINVNHVMSNAFGFGGNCSSIIFSKN
jgi:3-oxoacyl-(acyl-carrier-protein) synthase